MRNFEAEAALKRWLQNSSGELEEVVILPSVRRTPTDPIMRRKIVERCIQLHGYDKCAEFMTAEEKAQYESK